MDRTIHAASREGNLLRLRDCLSSGVNPSLRDANGYTPLHYAVSRLQLGAVRELLAAGADISIENNDGCTPLECMDIEAAPENEEDFQEIQLLLRDREYAFGEQEEVKEPECE